MTLLSPPEHRTDGRPAEPPEVLFREARQRRRRRWMTAAVPLLVAVLATGIGYEIAGGGTSAPSRSVGRSASSGNGGRASTKTSPSADVVFVHSAPASMAFPTSSDGFLAEGNDLEHTANAARSWTLVRPGRGAIEQVQFLSVKRGFLLTDEGLFATTDGGAKWTELGTRPVLQWFSFTTPTTGWARTEGVLLKTADGGKHWTHVETPVAPSDACFVSADSGWMLGPADPKGADDLWETIDGGASWREDPIDTAFTPAVTTSSYGSRIISCTAPSTILALVEPPGDGYSGGLEYGLYRSVDGGAVWDPVGVNPPIGHLAAAPQSFPDALAVTRATSAFLVASTGGKGTTSVGVLHGGRTSWHVVPLEGAGFGTPVLVAFPSTSSGWAVVTTGARQRYRLTLFETTNDGSTWSARPMLESNSR